MSSPAPSAQDLSILVIDDDPSVREALTEYLCDQGFRCASERSGEAGVVAAERQACDLVITDLRMPGIGGLEVLRLVKERRPDAEVIVVTGYATIEDGVEAMRRGAYDFILKPLKIDQFDAVVGRCVEWIRHKRSHAELQEVNRRLLELSRMKSRFLAITDHELRTPVTALDGMIHLLLRRHHDAPDGLKERLEQLGQVSGRLVELVRGIHDLSQCQTHQLPLSRDWLKPEELARRVSVDFEIAGFSRNLRFALRCEVPDGCRLHADGGRLRQALTELVQNAVKATPDGGRVEVLLTAAEVGGQRRFVAAVSDDGVGIPVEEQPHVFEAFYGVGDERHHHSSKHDFGGGGLGIGLSLALEIARAHGGDIEVESQPGCGSRFTLWLPLA